MEQIFVDRKLPDETWQALLEKLFPALSGANWQPLYTTRNTGTEPVFYATHFSSVRREFQWMLEVGLPLPGGVELLEQTAARYISVKSGLRTMVGFTHLLYPTSPYYSLVFINGKSYLADDVEFGAEEEGYSGLVKIIGAYPI